MEKWEKVAGEREIQKTAEALKKNGFEVFIAENGMKARDKVLGIIPKGAEVMNHTSMTLESIGVTKDILESGNYNPIRKIFDKMDQKTQGKEMRKLGSVPDYAIGSAHAITQEGTILIASASGSQLPSYAYGAEKIIFVVGAQKIVKSTDDGLKRIHEEAFPLEDKRALKVYGVHSSVNKVLILNKESVQGRITVILVREKIGF